jgi:predicted GNAT family acetyltransferase
MADITVVDNPDESRYDVLVDGKPAGFAEYKLQDGGIVFLHTEIDPAFEGHGVGGLLAAGALADAQDRGLAITPKCPFIAKYIRRHPEYESGES